jgi:hypothetical protein
MICDAEALPALQAKITSRSYHNPGFYGLRPNENLVMLVEQSLWARYETARNPEGGKP